MMNTQFKKIVHFPLALCLFLPISANAALEEILVTAQKREESLQDIPVTVTAFTGDAMIELGIEDTQELMAVTPGLVFNNTGALNQPYLRGVGTRFAVAGLESSVATYLDDQYISRPQMLLYEFNDIERVEVLKGPQGTLFGRNATGGAVRVITRGVGEEFEGGVTFTAGNYGLFGFKGALNIPVTDNLGMRFSALKKDRDGYVDNISTRPDVHDEYDDRDVMELRAKLRWDITDSTTLKLSLAYTETEDLAGAESQAQGPFSAGVARGGMTATEADEVALDVPASVKTETEALITGIRFEHDFSFARFTSISSYTESEAIFPIDSDGTDSPVITSYSHEHDYENFSQEFQLTSNNAGKLDWLLGLYYFEEELNYESSIEVGAPFLLSIGNTNLETDVLAIFGQATWQFNEHLALTVGARQSKEEKDVVQGPSLLGYRTLFGVGETPFVDDGSWDSFSPKATLEYRTKNDILLFASFARGFKSGGFNIPAVTNSVTLEPEEIDMYELGVKGDFQRVRVNGSLFYYDYTDLQVTRAAVNLGDGAVTVSTENASNAEILGLDLETTWLITDSTTLRAGILLMDSEYQDYLASARNFDASLLPVDATRVVAFDAEGHSLLRAPDESYFVNLSHDLSMNDGGVVRMSLNYSWKGEYDFDFIADPLAGDLRNEDYGLLGARITYTTPQENWRLSFWANNITDEEYFVDSVIASSGLRVTYGDPMTFGVDINFSF